MRLPGAIENSVTLSEVQSALGLCQNLIYAGSSLGTVN